MEVTDVAVVEQVLAGNADAFRHLVDRHSRSLFKVAYRMTGNQHDADDVVQEALLRAFRQLETFELRANFGTWVHRITVNCALDLLRARQRHRAANDHPDEEGSLIDSVPTSEPAQDRLLLNAEVREAVSRAMDDLSDNERTAFVLRHFEGMPVEEIGRTLGTQLSATKQTIFRAVRKLRGALEPLVRTA
ncbi:MAG TPA: RNA polymerase sigma factor [Thermoanaerobaculia bacterium]